MLYTDFLISLGKGLLLGGSICVLGMVLDKTVCAKSLKKIDQKLTGILTDKMNTENSIFLVLLQLNQTRFHLFRI